MPPQLIGAGVGRTGTFSLKLALEQLLDGTCHHMFEVGRDEGQWRTWERAHLGETVDWAELLEPYVAIVDWPGASVWRQLIQAFPDAPVLLSTRDDALTWLASAQTTIFTAVKRMNDAEQQAFHVRYLTQFCPDWPDPDALVAAYEAHNAAVRAAVDPDRLFEYQPGDGWAPLCAALGLPEPDEPFPHANTREQFLARMNQDRS